MLTTTLRPASAGWASALRCGWPSNTMCSYTSSLMTTTSVPDSTSARRCQSAACQMVPLGLCGVLTMSARVRGVRVAATRSGARCQGGSDAVEVGAQGVRVQWHPHHTPAGQHDVGHVTVVASFQHDHLVTGLHQRRDGGEDGLRGAGSDGDLGVGIAVPSGQRADLAGNGRAPRGHTGHRRVRVVARLHRAADGLQQPRIAVEVGKPPGPGRRRRTSAPART